MPLKRHDPMRRVKAWIWGIGLISMSFGWQVMIGHAQDEPNDYVGTRECRSCHRSYANDHEETFHSRTLIDVAEADEDDDEAVILADFDAETDLLTVMVEDSEQTFTVDDVFFTLGAGRHYQAYVTEVDDDRYRVLPAQWSIAEEAWTALPLAEDWADPAYDFNTQCAGCHTTNFDAEALTWDETGIQCESCHGMGLHHVEIADDAGSSVSDAEYAELSAAINFGLDSQVCGQCHIQGTHPATDLPFPVDYHPGMALEDTGFVPAATDNPAFWYSTGHATGPNMQFNEWVQSSHTSALASAQEADNFDASCLGCHSVAQRRADFLIDDEWVDEDEFDPLSTLDAHGFGVTCASCHNPHEVDNDLHLVDESYPLCISCHTNGEDTEGIHHPVQEVYEGLTLIENIEPIAGAHFSAEDGPTCNTCHMHPVETKNGLRSSHTFHPVSPAGAAEIADLQDACTTCHTDIEDPLQMQRLIDSVQANVEERIARAHDNLGDDTPEWVPLSLAAVEGDGSGGIHNFAYTNAILSSVEAELGIVGETLTDEDVVERVAAALPPPIMSDAPPPAPIVPAAVGLTAQSWIILAVCGLIIAYGGFACFVRGGQDD